MKKTSRWIYRQTQNGDIYYDRKNRAIHRNEQAGIVALDLCRSPGFDARAPIKVYFDFSYLCNLKCRHCITDSSPQADRAGELGTERIAELIEELARLSVLELGIGGGEPLIHPDIVSFLEMAENSGLNIVLTTNGLPVTAAIADRLKNMEHLETRVSLDGSRQVHENIRGPGTYDRTFAGIRTFLANDVPAVARLTLCNDDPQGLDELFTDLANAGVKTVKCCVFEPLGRGARDENHYLAKYPRSTATAARLADLAKKHRLELKLPADMAPASEMVDGGDLRRGKIKTCGAGFETGYISPRGEVRPCSGVSSRVFGNVATNSFIDVWTSPAAQDWRKRSLCHGHWSLCEGIRAN